MQALFNVAQADVHLGRFDSATAHGREALAWALDGDDEWLAMSLAGVLGAAAHGRGDDAEACSWFAQWSAAADAVGIVDPGVTRFHGDHIEALIATGAIDDARQRTTELRRRAERAGMTGRGSWALTARKNTEGGER